MVVAGGPAARAADKSTGAACGPDPVLCGLIAEALEKSPELAGGTTRVLAERARTQQAGALADPMVSVGYQNDGFTSLPLGRMDTTFFSLSATQWVTLPGKRGAREAVASFEAKKAEARLARLRLSLEADVRRGYVDLLLSRDQLALLGEIEALWQQAEGLAKTRYAVGEGSQADLLRAQLERSRLVQRRWALEADERGRRAALNRLRAHPLDEPLPTPAHLDKLGDPPVTGADAARADALDRSPELAEAGWTVEQARAAADLARRERVPDFSVTASVMPRGALEPMWQLGVGVPLPLFADRKQAKAVAEADLRGTAEASALEATRQVLFLRTEERLISLEATVRANRLYREGLLVLSRSAASSAMAQYGVGRSTFASVLDVLNGYLSDQAGYLESLAEAQRLAIAQAELSLAPGAGGRSAMAAGSVPGSGEGMRGSAPKSAPAPGAAPAAAGATSGGM